jgi:hypothetical protein
VRRRLAAAGAAAAFLLAGYTAKAESMPELHIYDGYWMLLGAAVAVAVVGALAWRWPRQASLAAVVAAAVLGAWVPIVGLALRGHGELMPRLRGTWHLMGGDVIGAAIPVGVACLWLALHAPAGRRAAES